EKGRCGLCWLAWGLLFGPLALLAAAGLPNKGPTRRTHAQCHMCHEFVLPQARKCKHCLTEFEPDKYTRGHTTAQSDRLETASLLKEEATSVLKSSSIWWALAILVTVLIIGFIA